MKKRLLFAFLAMCVAVSGYALTKGEFVYTPQGRFQIIGDNLNANNSFQDMTGWTVISAGKSLAEKFNTNANGLADGFNSVVCVDDPGDEANKGEGMYYKFEPTDATNGVYICDKTIGAIGAPQKILTTTKTPEILDFLTRGKGRNKK